MEHEIVRYLEANNGDVLATQEALRGTLGVAAEVIEEVGRREACARLKVAMEKPGLDAVIADPQKIIAQTGALGSLLFKEDFDSVLDAVIREKREATRDWSDRFMGFRRTREGL